MRLIKLAWQLVVSSRRDYRLSAGALALSCALISIAVLLVAALGSGLGDGLRSGPVGEYRIECAPHEIPAMLSATDRIVRSNGLAISSRQREPATLLVDDEAFPLTVVVCDLENELQFRGIDEIGDPNGAVAEVPKAVLLTDDTSGRQTRADGSEVLLATPGGVQQIAIVGTAGATAAGPELLLDNGVDSRMTVQAFDAPIEVVVRGVPGPLSPRVGNELERLGFVSTGWRSLAGTALAQAATPVVALFAGLFVISALIAGPTLQLRVRRHRDSFRLLTAWGFQRGATRRVAFWVDMIACTLPALVGGVAGSLVVGIASARGVPATSLLPWLIDATPVAYVESALRLSAIGVLVACGVGIVVGLTAALPTIRVVDRIVTDTNQWHL